MKIKKLEDLEIWEESLKLVNKVYKITKVPSFNKDFPLRDQVRRSAISIPSNIAEGFERVNNTEFKRFLVIAKGSADELRTQLIIALNQKYITQPEFKKLKQDIINISGKIGNLIKYLRKK